MSIGSDLSWHTTEANFDVDSHIGIDVDLIDEHSRSYAIAGNTVKLPHFAGEKVLVPKETKKSRSSPCARLNALVLQIRKLIPWQMPWTIIVISSLQVLIHLIGCDETFEKFKFSPYKKYDLWRFLTYHFLHSGSAHLLLNVFLQIVVATPLETEQSHLRVLFVYVGGILFGSLGAAVISPTQELVGASAGVYSLLISHLSHCVLNYSVISRRLFRISAVTVLCCSDTIFLVLYSMHRKSTQPRISWPAHACGAIAGLLLGFIAFKQVKNVNDRMNCSRFVSTILLLGLAIVFISLLFF